MPDLGKQISFVELLESCRRIKVPQIQRDYAQGRDTAKEVRDGFLDALHEALVRPAGDTPSLNLDFVYGSMERDAERFFLPLDGQQRLTTLFLLHWYLAWRDGALPSFQAIAWDGQHSRFSYAVRPSSAEFFDELMQYVPDGSPQQVRSVRKLLENQPWFYLHWRLDPTIQSALTMLDAIHARFATSRGFFARLVDQERPAITFQLLPLEHFGLSDDLYIKMNARGKPLTPFETFKARFEEHLKEFYPTEHRKIGGTFVPVHEFFSRRMDTLWTDFFWSYRTPASAVFDSAVMNLFWIVAWVSIDPERSSNGGPPVTRYRHGVGSYTEFHELGLLTKTFADNLICLLEAWSSGGGQLNPQLPDARYFNEKAFFARIRSSPTSLQYSDLLLFAAFTSYLRVNEGNVIPAEFQEWMRVVFNLVHNSDIERPDEFERSLGGLQRLLPHSREILPHLATMESEPLGFSRSQVQEESLKAQLMLSKPDWASHLHEAETHGYFRGQIGFLLDFSGTRAKAKERAVREWTPDEHNQLQEAFGTYLAKARLTFNERGLVAVPGEPHQWQRSLLALGDYLLHLSRNRSFGTNPPANPDSWKRFLRGDGSRREILRQLWDRLDPHTDLGAQLAEVIADTRDMETWRAAVVSHPEVIDYCEQRQIRHETWSDELYLLRRKQMNGAHAELFSFILHLELSAQSDELRPLQIGRYQSVSGTWEEPYFNVMLTDREHSAAFRIESANGKFRISVNGAQAERHEGLEYALVNGLRFEVHDGALVCSVPRKQMRQQIRQLAGVCESVGHGHA